jgi:hypothetical protein
LGILTFVVANGFPGKIRSYSSINKESSMKRKSFIAAVCIALVALLNVYQTVFAHEEITVGDYSIEVGWLQEPPFAGQMNGITIDVTHTNAGTVQPVEDISSLTVTLSYGGQEKSLEFEPVGEEAPGEFVASVIPTIPGEYEVIFGGTLGETAVDAQTHVQEVQPADVLAFPSVDQAPSSGDGSGWLVWLSLLIGLIGVGLGAAAFRKASMR